MSRAFFLKLEQPMNRILILAVLVSVTSLAGCPDTNPGVEAEAGGSGGGGQGGASGQGGGNPGRQRAGQRRSRWPWRKRGNGRHPATGRGARGSAQARPGFRSRPAARGWRAGVVCGAVACVQGQVCCNASCGICTPPGGVCVQIACPAMGACGTDSDCRLFDDYCTGCDCRALGKSDPNPTCSRPG